MKISGLIRGFCGVRSSDLFLVSFPKAGNTYLRLLTVYYFRALLGVEKNKVVSFDYLNGVLPELFFNNWEGWEFAKIGSPKLVKSHRYLSFIMGERVVGVIRDPRLCMLSYYRYAQSRNIKSQALTLSDFIRDPGYGYEKCVSLQKKLIENAGYIIRYEDMRKSPHHEFVGYLKFINVEVRSELVDEAVELSSMENTRLAQKISSDSFNQRFQGNYFFANQGSTQIKEDAFNADDIDYLNSIDKRYSYTY